MSGWRPLLVNRPFHFEPTKHHAGLAVFLGKWALPTACAGPGTEQAPRIRRDQPAGQQPDIQRMHVRLRRDIEIAEMTQQSWRCFRRDRDGFIAATGRNVVEVGDKPLVGWPW